tara:strand:+ start:887 stop:1075 length:189 start_codon:yes stop_codon:yes gene_type:complete
MKDNENICWTEKFLELRYNCDMDDEQIFDHLKNKYGFTDNEFLDLCEQVQNDLEEGSADNEQ